MSHDRMQTQRFELKYQIPEVTAEAVRRYVRGYLEPDSYGASPEIPAYPVHSLYLDSSDLALCHSTINGDRNRFKLRARYYNENPDAPVCLEIKRRVDRCILKQRAFVRREFFPALLAGETPSLLHLSKPDARHFTSLQVFSGLCQKLAARPIAHVAYQREAWLSSGHDAVRVTFDREVQCEPVAGPHLTTAFKTKTNVFGGVVILELKFTDRFPTWMRDMVRSLGLTQANAAKYVDGVLTSGLERFQLGPRATTRLANPARQRRSLPALAPVPAFLRTLVAP